MPKTDLKNPSVRKAYIITGPTSGIGRRTALELAKHGTVVLVGRDREKLDEVQKTIEQKGRHAVSVVCDLSDIASVRRAAAEIIALNLPIAGLLNNAGIMQMRATKNAQGWDMTFATNHLGPFALTEALVPHLPDGANVVFVASAVEDPERKPAKAAGFRGGRYISAEASARGEWKPGGSNNAGCGRLRHVEAVQSRHGDGVRPRDSAAALQRGRAGLYSDHRPRARGQRLRALLVEILMPVPLLAPFMKYWSTPKRAARVITKVLINASGQTGVYYDEGGHPMLGSALVRDPKFQDRVVAETRALLSTVPARLANKNQQQREVLR